MQYISAGKASKWLGVHPNTLRNWAKAGKIPYIRTKAGQRRYDVAAYLGATAELETVCYCRVSSYKQKDDLERQVTFMREKFPDARIVKDIGSGINLKRKGLTAVLDSAISGNRLRLVVAHRDRLARFGTDLIRYILEKSGGTLLVLSERSLSPEQELTQDLLAILHVFSCRMHGLRSYKNQIAESFSNRPAKETVQAMD